jgi:hypothetical protein
LFEGLRELLDAGEARGWLFGQRLQNHLLQRWCDGDTFLAQWRWGRVEMLGTYLKECALEGEFAAEPFMTLFPFLETPI